MNVYILYIKGENDVSWDYYDSHMVVAATSKQARALCPQADECRGYVGDKGNIWMDKECSVCRLVKDGDIVSSFYAG